MLLTSAADEHELEAWRTKFGSCQLSPAKMRPQPAVADALVKLPGVLALMIRLKLKAAGWLGPLYLTGEEVAEITAVTGIESRSMMAMLLNVASALSSSPGEGNHVGAILEGESGGLYFGPSIVWQGKGLKSSTHGVQTAVLGAWQQGETRLRSLMVESPPCACCRQFLRETWNWNKIKVIHAVDGPDSGKTGAFANVELGAQGLKVGGLKSRLMGEAQRKITLGKSDANELINQAAEAASLAYAPYSGNYAGIAVRTKRGMIFQGRYAECVESIVGVLAIESALINMVLAGVSVGDISEVLLVETRGTVTQFSITQKFMMTLGNIPFRFMMAT